MKRYGLWSFYILCFSFVSFCWIINDLFKHILHSYEEICSLIFCCHLKLMLEFVHWKFRAKSIVRNFNKNLNWKCVRILFMRMDMNILKLEIFPEIYFIQWTINTGNTYLACGFALMQTFQIIWTMKMLCSILIHLHRQ